MPAEQSSDLPLSGLVLAAGRGSRYGMPKILAAQGTRLRQATGALLDAGCADVVVTTGAANSPIALPERCRCVPATHWDHGLSQSVATGLAATTGDLLITLVDTPDITGECARRVLRAGRANPAGIARATFRGRPGHPVFLAARHRSALLDALRATSSANADRGVWFHLPPGVAALATSAECSDIATGADIDLPNEETSAL